MARPKKQGMDYFPHDVDARNDLKIRKLRAIYGNDGYAFYFILLENIYRSKDYCLSVSDTETRLILAEEIKISGDKFDEMLDKCLDLELFDKHEYDNNKILTSDAIKVRTEPIENKRKRNKEYFRNKNQENNAISDAKTMAESTQSKVKESKVKESKVNNNKLLSDDEKIFIEVLETINDYPLDIEKDISMMHELECNYSSLDILAAIKEFAIYKEENPLIPNSNARKQINTHFQKCIEWNKCLKQNKKNEREIWV